jgi:hypothetical protein
MSAFHADLYAQECENRSRKPSQSPSKSVMSIGTIWWDFDGTLVSRPLMWSEAGCRCLARFAPGHRVTRDQLRLCLKNGFPWHRPDHGHPELTPEQWWNEVGRCYTGAFSRLGCRIDRVAGLLAAIRADILDAQHYGPRAGSITRQRMAARHRVKSRARTRRHRR